MLIYIIDSYPIFRSFLSKMLSEAFEVCHFGSLAQIQEDELGPWADLIILGVNSSPTIEELAVYQNLHKQHPNLKTVIYYEKREDPALFAHWGAERRLSKNDGLPDLMQAISDLLPDKP